MMRITTIVGARPQFIKAAAVSRVLRASPEIDEILIHTGQHYDNAMSDVFFRELGIPHPDVNLGIGSASHGAQTGRMLEGLELQCRRLEPDAVLVYGDTNSTLAGALAAAKLHIPVAHVEAGLRSYNRRMPEELNRVLTDHIASLLFAPSRAAVANLRREGLTEGIVCCGDVMFDALSQYWQKPDDAEREEAPFVLVTVHRAENTDDPKRFRAICEVLDEIAARGMRVRWPVHPRAREAMKKSGIAPTSVELLDPVSYLELLDLMRRAEKVLTDSGGMQKEALWLATPCITLREETEWVETVQHGWNVLAGTDRDRIVDAFNQPPPETLPPPVYGDGHAAERILETILDL